MIGAANRPTHGGRPEPIALQRAGVAPAPEPVAVRYKDRNGRWRYLNYPFTKGWDFPPNLGTPIPLYEKANAPGVASVAPTHHWRCVCGVTAMPLTDETRCKCADIYEQAWSRVDGPLPAGVPAAEKGQP